MKIWGNLQEKLSRKAQNMLKSKYSNKGKYVESEE